MRFLVIGGAGNVGEAIIKHLLRDPDVEEVICGDVDMARAERLVATLKDDRLRCEYVNALDFLSVMYAMADVDVVFAALPPIPQMFRNIVDAAIDTGSHYIDFGSAMCVLYHHLAMSDVVKDAGITLLTCMGEDPGLSDVCSRYASDKLDKVEMIKIRDGAMAAGKAVLATYAPTVFLGEALNAGFVYEHGRIKRVKPLSGKEIYKFPDPVGPLPTYYVPHEEPVTIPRGLKKEVGVVDFKLTVPDEVIAVLDTLKAFGLLSRRPIRVKGVEISPLDFLMKLVAAPAELAGVVKGHECLVIEVIGEKGGKKLMYKFTIYMTHEEAYEKYGVTSTAFLTGTTGAIAALALAKGEIKERGTVVPAQLPPEMILERAKKAGIPIKEEVIELE